MTGLNKILLVEDDPSAGILIKNLLESEGFETELYRSAESAWERFKIQEFKLCLLDVMLPISDGFTLARQIRKVESDIPIVFITAKSMKEDKINGFESGADDYICKPFEPEELIYRIKAIVKRTASKIQENDLGEFQIGLVRFNSENHSLMIKGERKRVTKKENAILLALFKERNNIVRKDDLLHRIWGEADYFTGRSLDVFIAKLRGYLKEVPEIQIENVHGVGFILKEKD